MDVLEYFSTEIKKICLMNVDCYLYSILNYDVNTIPDGKMIK